MNFSSNSPYESPAGLVRHYLVEGGDDPVST